MSVEVMKWTQQYQNLAQQRAVVTAGSGNEYPSSAVTNFMDLSSS
jgi:hypothetical protein